MAKARKQISFILIIILLVGLVSACDFIDSLDAPINQDNAGVTRETANDNSDTEYEISIGTIDDGYYEERDISEDLLYVPLTQSPAIPDFLVPVASGSKVKKNDKAIIDYSNASDGYVMVKWLAKTNEQLRVQIIGPSETKYVYTIWPDDTFEVFPLSDGNGKYTIGVFEHVDAGRYSRANSVDLTVTLKDEFMPFLHPNQYVNFNKESDAVAKAAGLVANYTELLDIVAAVYTFVTGNITYDTDLANSIINGERPGYLPDLDLVLARRKGICFDYAALMTAMLRSQSVPTKLVVGYASDVRHAWINVYSEETGWINNVIFFDGEEWIMMDPTFAAAARNAAALQSFIGDGSNYTTTHLY